MFNTLMGRWRCSRPGGSWCSWATRPPAARCPGQLLPSLLGRIGRRGLGQRPARRGLLPGARVPLPLSGARSLGTGVLHGVLGVAGPASRRPRPHAGALTDTQWAGTRRCDRLYMTARVWKAEGGVPRLIAAMDEDSKIFGPVAFKGGPGWVRARQRRTRWLRRRRRRRRCRWSPGRHSRSRGRRRWR